MRRLFFKEIRVKKWPLLFAALFCLIAESCAKDSSSSAETAQDVPQNSQSKNLVVYFSWSGRTQSLAEMISQNANAELFRLEPEEPYPTDYSTCTEVAKEELEKGVYRKLVATPDLKLYDTVFVGTPVWWHTASMVVQGFLQNNAADLRGKIIVPFCTFAATYGQETLDRILELTPNSEHLEGLATTSPNAAEVKDWIEKIRQN